MAHLIEQMAYTGHTPWHGLGNPLTANQPIDVWAKQAGMDWEICNTPVRFITGKPEAIGEVLTYPDRNVLYRSDTNAPLSVVGQRYKVVQPREILEFYRDLTEVSGFELETAGVLKGGRKMWALARTGQSGTLKGNDVTNAYILLATACDGSMATTAQFTSIRVVCNNTLAVALADTNGVVKVPHSTNFDPQAVKKKLGISVSTWNEFMYRMKALSERNVTSREAKDYISQIFIGHNHDMAEKTQARSMTKVLNLFDGQGMGAELTSAKGTAFGLLNAVTEFVDHERKTKSIDHRLDSAWFGQGATIKRKALDQAVSMIA